MKTHIASYFLGIYLACLILLFWLAVLVFSFVAPSYAFKMSQRFFDVMGEHGKDGGSNESGDDLPKTAFFRKEDLQKETKIQFSFSSTNPSTP